MNIALTTQETLGLMKDSLAKNVTISTGLTAFDLQAPAKNLYPTITPLRNSIARVARLNPGDAAHWRSIFATTGSGFDAMGWVPEGQRSASMSYSAVSVTLPYVTLGEEDTVTFEAEAAAQGFEDINATATLRILQKTMRKEETALLGGNTSLALGKPGTPTLSASGTGGTLPAATYSVIVVALTFEGYRNSTLAGGVATTMTITGNDGNTYTLSGGSSLRSNNATQAVAAGQTLFATVPVVNGAVAYAWYVGSAGSETLQAITTINSAAFSAPLIASGQQPATAVTADNSRNPGLAFDGLLTDGFNPSTELVRASIAVWPRGDRHDTDAFGPGLDPRDRQYAAADVEQLSAVADCDLRQRAGAEEHHGEMPNERRLGRLFAIMSTPLSRRLTSSPPPASFAGTTIRSLASRSRCRFIRTCRPARSWRTASDCRRGINRTRRPMSRRS